MKLSIIIPAYNEEKTIFEVLDRVKSVDLLEDIEKEIIVIDDGSTDFTKEILKKINGIRIIRNKINRGKGFSARAGIKASNGNIIVFQDADMEYDPNQISLLLNRILNGENVVYGSRFKGRIHDMPLSHFIGNKVISFVTSIIYGQKITDTETCYKMFRRNSLSNVTLRSNRFGIEPEITSKLIKKGYKIAEVPIKYEARSKAEKKINWKDGILAIWYLFKFRFSD
jgi:glycosyltransferase involved in cell wall biosynthesis